MLKQMFTALQVNYKIQLQYVLHLVHEVFELYMHLFIANNVIKELPVKRIALISVTEHALDSHLSLYFTHYTSCM